MTTYQYVSYSPDFRDVAESFLDDTARYFTGCDEGWQDYYDSVTAEPDTVLDENFWIKVVLYRHTPIALLAIGLHEGTMTISEFFISPDHRGKGHGSAVLSQLLAHAEDIIGTSFKIAEAVIFPNNVSSVRCFEKAGFVFESAHPDGDVLYYTYSESKTL